MSGREALVGTARLVADDRLSGRGPGAPDEVKTRARVVDSDDGLDGHQAVVLDWYLLQRSRWLAPIVRKGTRCHGPGRGATTGVSTTWASPANLFRVGLGGGGARTGAL